MQFPKDDVIWPTINDVAAPFYEGMRNKKVMIQQCESCQTCLPPAQVRCDACGSDALKWVESPGLGDIYSFVVFHRSFHPFFDDKLPYTVALVELDEGPRLQAIFTGHDCVVGMKVQPAFMDVVGKHTLLAYQPAEND
jgi:uncharacterized OB-fold protein